ncbi:MAG TPA: NUDIX domain-containing protein [Caulobacterales bacterium]|nr:NUDIX domain-containing protein [Caulobacterales bacterium]
MYVRRKNEQLKVLLVHPGGPFWRNKDLGAWTIPKGLANPSEDFLAAAQREFEEETGLSPSPPFLPLASLKQKSGKLIHCWAFEGEPAPAMIGASTFEVEWPRKSGRTATFPEIDDARLFPIDDALRRILPGQADFVRELAAKLG